MSGMALRSWFGKNNQSEALVKAPSMDLIVSDTGPRLPEPTEITCQMSTEQFEAYIKSIHRTKNTNMIIRKEGLRQALSVLGCKRYPNKEVQKFLNQQLKNLLASKSLGKMGLMERSDLTARYCPYSKYNNFLPPRIINKVQEIQNNDYCPSNIYFWISDLYSRSSQRSLEKRKHNTEICFLAVSHLELSIWEIQNDINTVHVIDAWRGPTFSDEEARLP